MGSPSRNVQYHPPRLSEDRLNLPQPHSPSLPTHCTAPGNRECARPHVEVDRPAPSRPANELLGAVECEFAVVEEIGHLIRYRLDRLRSEGEPQVGYSERRLRNPGDDLRQLVAGPTSRLQHPAVELDPVRHARVLDEPGLLRRSAQGRRLHAKPASRFGEIAHRQRVAVSLAEEIDVVAVGIQVRRAAPLIVAVLRAREQGSDPALQVPTHVAGVHHQNSPCVGGGGFMLPSC